jgi:hypothetical protein
MKGNSWLRRIALLGLMSAAMATMALDAGTVQASPGRLSFKDMAARSELVFAGGVEKIEYLLSEPTAPEGVRIPHTFVTYRVERVFLGEAPGSLIVLRFVGGWDARKMRYMASSHTPQFDVGDHDILFVEGNTKRMCPLVGNEEGRLRIVRGRIYTEMGEAVRLGPGGRLESGETVLLPEVATTNVEGRVFRTLTTGPRAVEFPGSAIGAEALMATIADSARSMLPAGTFLSADRTKPFAGPDQTPAPPPAENPLAKKTPGRFQ